MLRHKTLRNTVLLIYANKIDYEHSMTVPEIVEGLDVQKIIGDRKWFIQKTCAISGQGLKEGLDWLTKALDIRSGGHSTNFLNTHSAESTPISSSHSPESTTTFRESEEDDSLKDDSITSTSITQQ